MNFDKPKFITFEGGEGSGKSTQSKMLHEYLRARHIKSIHTREVGGTPEAEQIRNLLVYSELLPVSELMLVMAARYEHINNVIIPALQDGNWVICDRFVDSTACYQSGESGLTIDDIYELHDQLMKANYKNSAGADGASAHSISAHRTGPYNTSAHGTSPYSTSARVFDTDISNFQNITSSQNSSPSPENMGIMPDMTFFMDIPPQIGLRRAGARGDVNKFEGKNIDFHMKIYERFKKLATEHEDRIISIPCENLSIDGIHKEVLNKIFKV